MWTPPAPQRRWRAFALFAVMAMAGTRCGAASVAFAATPRDLPFLAAASYPQPLRVPPMGAARRILSDDVADPLASFAVTSDLECATPGDDPSAYFSIGYGTLYDILQTLEVSDAASCAAACLADPRCGGFMLGDGAPTPAASAAPSSPARLRDLLSDETTSVCATRMFPYTSGPATNATIGCATRVGTAWYTRADASFFYVTANLDCPAEPSLLARPLAARTAAQCATACMAEATCGAFSLNASGGCALKGFGFSLYGESQGTGPATAATAGCVPTPGVSFFVRQSFARNTLTACVAAYSSPGCCASSVFYGLSHDVLLTSSGALQLDGYGDSWTCYWYFLNPLSVGVYANFVSYSTEACCDWADAGGGHQSSYFTTSSMLVTFSSDLSVNFQGFNLTIDLIQSGERPAASYFYTSPATDCGATLDNLQTFVGGEATVEACAAACLANVACGGFAFAGPGVWCALRPYVYTSAAAAVGVAGCVSATSTWYTRADVAFFAWSHELVDCDGDGDIWTISQALDASAGTTADSLAKRCATGCMAEPTCGAFAMHVDDNTCVLKSWSGSAGPMTATDAGCYPRDGSAFFVRAAGTRATFSPCVSASSPGCCAASSYGAAGGYTVTPADGSVSFGGTLALAGGYADNWRCAWRFTNVWQSELTLSFSTYSTESCCDWADAGGGRGASFFTTGDVSVIFSSDSSVSSPSFSGFRLDMVGTSSGGASSSEWNPPAGDYGCMPVDGDGQMMPPPPRCIDVENRDVTDRALQPLSSWPLVSPFLYQTDDGTAYAIDYAGSAHMQLHGIEFSTDDVVENFVFNQQLVYFADKTQYGTLDNITFGGGALSVTCWAYIDSITGNSAAPFFTFYSSPAARGASPTDVLSWTTNGVVTYKPRSAARTTITLPEPLPLCQWVHLAAVFDVLPGSGAKTLVTLYVDGAPQITAQIALPLFVTRDGNYFGKPSRKADPSLIGALADIKSFARALTPAEVAYIHRGCLPDEEVPPQRAAPMSLDELDTGAYASLRSLEMSSLQLSGTLPAALGALAALTYLDVSNNSLTGMLPPLMGASQLNTLKVSNNQLQGALHVPSSCAYVYAAGNNFTELSASDFVGECGLVSLDVSSNNLTGLPGGFNTACSSLAYLFLDNNSVRTLTGLLTRNMSELSVANNNLSAVQLDDTLTGLATLESLDLSSSHLSGTLPQWLFTSPRLTYLDLKDNAFTGRIPSVESPPQTANGDLVYFQFLSLSYNKLSGPIPAGKSVSVNAGSQVFFDANNLVGTIPPDLVLNSVLLVLNNNQLSGSIPDAVTESSLFGLMVSNNRLSGSLPAAMETAASLAICLLSDDADGQRNNFSCPLPPNMPPACAATICNCRPGTFFNATGVNGATCYSCPSGFFSLESSTACTACAIGSVSSAGAGACTVCAPGQFANLTSQTCHTCAAGTRSAQNGSTSCEPCAPGSVSQAGATACTTCQAGFYAVAATQTCASCSAGSFSSAGTTFCIPCAPGSVALAGAASCTGCSGGSFANVATQTCDVCAAGTFSGSMASSCMPCTPGSVSARNATQCSTCPAGSVANSVNQTCDTCSPGSFSGPGMTSCQVCAPGSVALAGAALCTGCFGGAFANSTTQACDVCPAGTYSAPLATSCMTCAPGSVSARNATQCSTCTPGTFANVTAQQCHVCPFGTYSGSSATSCTLCAPGYLSDDDRRGCTACPAGRFLNATAAACQTCPLGSYSPTSGATACTVNPPGFASTVQTNFASTLTLPGVSSFGAAQNATLVAAVASSLNVSASAVTITGVNVSGATPAASGRRLSAPSGSAAVAFDVATEDLDVASSLRSALNNTAAFSTSLTATLRASPDPVLASVTAVTAAPPVEAAHVTKSQACGPGTYMSAATQRCVACDAGLVATTAGSTACSACPTTSARLNASYCSPCPDNSKVALVSVAACACNPGFYDALFGAQPAAPVCTECPPGGVCETGFVGAADGFWRESNISDVFYRCREGKCLKELVCGPGGPLGPPCTGNVTSGGNATGTNATSRAFARQRRVLVDATAANATYALGTPTNCVDGSDGPLCALCLPGFALQSGECAPCDPKDAWENWTAGSQVALLVCCLAFACVFIAFALFQPLSPPLERAADACVNALKACFGSAKKCITCGLLAAPAAVAAADDHKGHTAGATSGHAAETTHAAVEGSAGEPAAEAPHHPADAAPAPAAHDAAHSEAHYHHVHGQARAGGALEQARGAAVMHQAASSAAATVGMVNAMLDADAELDGGEFEEGVGGQLDFFDWLEELADKLKKISKILVKCVSSPFTLSAVAATPLTCPHTLHERSFYQIVSTFLKSLDIPWPSARVFALCSCLSSKMKTHKLILLPPLCARRLFRRCHGARKYHQPQFNTVAEDRCVRARRQRRASRAPD